VIAQDEPDLWIWTGDNVYADTEDPAKFRETYDLQLSNTAYASFVESVPFLTGTWDDHDYGVNDGGAEYPEKELAKDEMYRFLGVSDDDPSQSRSGTHRSYNYGPEDRRVKVILLDTRWFRDPIERTSGENAAYLPNEEGTLLGEEQWAWLERQLGDSEADVTVIVSSIQVIAAHRFEKWANFPNELQRFYDLLAEKQPKNAFIISGDRHAGEISVEDIEGWADPLVDITSSGLTNTWSRMFDETNSRAVTDKVIDINYGLIEIDWSNPDDPAVNASIKGMEGTYHAYEI
jgi:alkaline phosphatase D